jgi:hypothetical protein
MHQTGFFLVGSADFCLVLIVVSFGGSGHRHFLHQGFIWL